MLVKYKIIKVDPTEHSIVVRFYTDAVTEECLAVCDPGTGEINRNSDNTIQACRTDYLITLFETPVLSGEALQLKIMQNAPVEWFTIKEKITNPDVDTSMSALVSLVGVENSVTVLPQPAPRTPMFMQVTEL